MITNKLVAEFKRPASVEFTQNVVEENYGVFTAKPYERGFGTTVANSLRRTLLSSIPGYAVIAVKFDSINNEFQNLKGVYQDTSEIIANFKNVHIGLKDPNIRSRVLHFEIKGKKSFYAKDLKVDEHIVIGNPDFLIFSANKETQFTMDIQIDYGKGYVPADFFVDSIETEGTIAIDGNFSPILNVSYEVDKMRVGRRNDYEKLRIQIRTNGVIHPEDALKKAAQILKESYLTFNNVETEILTQAVDTNRKAATDEKDKIYYQSVFAFEFTVRSHFFFKMNDIREIGQLVTKSEEELLEKKKFSSEVLKEIKEVLAENHLEIGMKNINYAHRSII